MTTVDILLLKVLEKSNDEINAKKIHDGLGLLEISCCVASIYRRLKTLKSRIFVTIHWKTGNKFYSISPSGKHWLNTFENQLQA